MPVLGILGLPACTASDSERPQLRREAVLSKISINKVVVRARSRGIGAYAGPQQTPFSDEQIIADVQRAADSGLVGLGSGTPTTLNIEIIAIVMNVFDSKLATKLSTGASQPGGVYVSGRFEMATPKGARRLPADEKYGLVVRSYVEQLGAELESATVLV